jgi:hypothetical protein
VLVAWDPEPPAALEAVAGDNEDGPVDSTFFEGDVCLPRASEDDFLKSDFLFTLPELETAFFNSSMCLASGSTPPESFDGDGALGRLDDPLCNCGSFDKSTLYALLPTLM